MSPSSLLRAGLQLAVAGVLTAAAWSAHAAYPAKPVTIVVPFPAGGGTDVIFRSVQVKLQAELGVPVIIDNRAGAGRYRRHRLRGQGRARRLHAGCRDDHHHRLGASRLPEAALRPAGRPGARGHARHHPLRAGGVTGAAGAEHRRVHPLRQGQARHAQLRQHRQWHREPPGGRAVQAAHRRRDDAHSLPRRSAGADRPDGGPDPGAVRQPRRARAAGSRVAHARAGDQPALGGVPRAAHLRGFGHQGLQARALVRPDGARRHAQGRAAAPAHRPRQGAARPQPARRHALQGRRAAEPEPRSSSRRRSMPTSRCGAASPAPSTRRRR
jgi:hypothetical protein